MPYEVAKEMLLVDHVESKGFPGILFNLMYDELPKPKKRNKKVGL